LVCWLTFFIYGTSFQSLFYSQKGRIDIFRDCLIMVSHPFSRNKWSA
jgi:hypothetical protein